MNEVHTNTRSFLSAATAPTAICSSDFLSQHYSKSDAAATSYMYSDDNDDEETSSFSASLLGRHFRGVEDLVSHLRPGTYDSEFRGSKLHGPPSVVSDFDYQGEFADFRFTRDFLVFSGAETTVNSMSGDLMNGRLADDSRNVMKEFQNALWNRRTGQPAFKGDQISDELKLSFMDDACAIRGHQPHLSKSEELKLNRDAYERFRDWAPVWSEDFDKVPVPVGDVDTVIKLERCGKTRVLSFRKTRVRTDMPEDPYLFSLCKLGIEAARALEEYQADEEQIERNEPILELEHPRFEDNLTLDLLGNGPYEYLHDNPGKNDAKIERAIASITALCAHPEAYDDMLANDPDAGDCGSGILYDRFLLEHEVIVDIWNDLQRRSNWTALSLWDAGFLTPEDDFGDNPEYLNAKLLWWRQKMGIRGLEAIVRYHFEHVRTLRRPSWGNFFLSVQAEYKLNQMSSDWNWAWSTPSSTVARVQVFDELHAQPVDRKSGYRSQIKAWIFNQVEDGSDLLPDNLFDNNLSGHAAYNSLLGYQDSKEPGTEWHQKVQDWARPRQVHRGVDIREKVCSAKTRLVRSEDSHKDQRLDRGIAAPFDPEKIAQDLTRLLRQRKNAENELMSLIQPDFVYARPEIPVFYFEAQPSRPNDKVGKRATKISKPSDEGFALMARHRSKGEEIACLA